MNLVCTFPVYNDMHTLQENPKRDTYSSKKTYKSTV